MKKTTKAGDQPQTPTKYLTTTQLAKLCGVSRFSIINWVNQGKISAAKTMGGHYRIPVAEGRSFLETFAQGAGSGDQRAGHGVTAAPAVLSSVAYGVGRSVRKVTQGVAGLGGKLVGGLFQPRRGASRK